MSITNTSKQNRTKNLRLIKYKCLKDKKKDGKRLSKQNTKKKHHSLYKKNAKKIYIANKNCEKYIQIKIYLTTNLKNKIKKKEDDVCI